MASVVEICNRALSNIGNSRSINSLTEASKEAGNVRCTLRPAVMLCFLILTELCYQTRGACRYEQSTA